MSTASTTSFLGLVCLAGVAVACGSSSSSSNGDSSGRSLLPDGSPSISVGDPNGGTVTPTTEPFDACAATFEEAENAYPPADIIFLIDNSPSMRDEIEWTRQNLNRFSQTIAARGLDPRIVVISCLTDNCDQKQALGICVEPPLGAPGACTLGAVTDDTKPPSYLHLNVRMPSNQLLARATSNYSKWAQVLRPNAETHFVAISDDNDMQSAAAFHEALAQLSPPLTSFHFHGIYSSLSKEDACAIGTDQPCCRFAAPGGQGSTYADLVEMTQGVGADLCAQDFAPVFAQFADAVIASSQLSCDWAIPPPPAGQTLDPQLINVSFTDTQGIVTRLGYVQSSEQCKALENAWYYDDPTHPERVVACPGTCEVLKSGKGATLAIAYGCATLAVETLL